MYCLKCSCPMEYDAMSDEFVPTNSYEFHLESQVNELIATEKIDEDEGDLMFSTFFDCKHEISREVAYVIMDEDDRRMMEVN